MSENAQRFWVGLILGVFAGLFALGLIQMFSDSCKDQLGVVVSKLHNKAYAEDDTYEFIAVVRVVDCNGRNAIVEKKVSPEVYYSLCIGDSL